MIYASVFLLSLWASLLSQAAVFGGSGTSVGPAGWPTQITITHGNGTSTTFAALNQACSALVSTDTMLQLPAGQQQNWCQIPHVTFSPGLLFTGIPTIRFFDQNGGNPDVSGLPYFDVTSGSGSSICCVLSPSGGSLAFIEQGGVNVTLKYLEVFATNSGWFFGWDDLNTVRITTGGAHTTFDHVALHDMNIVVDLGGPSGDTVFQNSVVFDSVGDGSTLAHIIYAGGNSAGTCNSVTITNTTVRDVASGPGSTTGGYGEGHALKTRCLSTTVSHSILAVRGNPFFTNCDSGLDAIQTSEGGVVSITHSVLENGPCDGNIDAWRLSDELLSDSYAKGTAGVNQSLINQVNLNFQITGTFTPGSDIITGISPSDMALITARNLASGPNDEQYMFFFGATGADPLGPDGQMWNVANLGGGGCSNYAGSPFFAAAIFKAEASSSSIQVQCFDNGNGYNATTAHFTGSHPIQVTLHAPYSGRTHSNTISDSIILLDKNQNTSSAGQQAAVVQRSPAQITAANVKIVGNPNFGEPVCWGSNNCTPSAWNGFLGPPAPPVPNGLYPANYPWTATTAQIIDTGTSIYASRSAAATAGVFAGVTCAPTSLSCLPAPP